MSNLTAAQIAEIHAKVAANTQPTTVTLDGVQYAVPYRIAQDIRAGRRVAKYISQGRGRRAVGNAHQNLAEVLGVSVTTALRIAREVR